MLGMLLYQAVFNLDQGSVAELTKLVASDMQIDRTVLVYSCVRLDYLEPLRRRGRLPSRSFSFASRLLQSFSSKSQAA